MIIAKYVPEMIKVDKSEMETAEFSSTEGLLNIPFVKYHSQESPTFIRFSLKKYPNGTCFLIAETDISNDIVGEIYSSDEHDDFNSIDLPDM